MNFLDFFRNYQTFKSLNDNRFKLSWRDRYPILKEKTKETNFDRHYIYHPAWAARVLAKTKPNRHVDISSTLTFCSIVSAFIPVEFYDFRPPSLKLNNLSIGFADLTNLPFKDNTLSSLSCMHTVEHVGLGRYGDEINPKADLKAVKELKRVVAPNGTLLFVVPVGKPRIIFNAHRIYSPKQILSCFEEMKLIEFALVPNDSGKGLIVNPSEKLCNRQIYACGCFWFKKV